MTKIINRRNDDVLTIIRDHGTPGISVETVEGVWLRNLGDGTYLAEDTDDRYEAMDDNERYTD